jgi:DNA-directed RNA polymerase specialized sigma24 family protein
MARIFRNAAFDRMRRSRDGLADLADLAITLEAPPIELDNTIDLARALERLTEDQRTAISMMYLYGLM